MEATGASTATCPTTRSSRTRVSWRERERERREKQIKRERKEREKDSRRHALLTPPTLDLDLSTHKKNTRRQGPRRRRQGLELLQQPPVLQAHQLLERRLDRPLRRRVALGAVRGEHRRRVDRDRGLLVRRLLRLRLLQLLRRQRLPRWLVRVLHLLERVPGEFERERGKERERGERRVKKTKIVRGRGEKNTNKKQILSHSLSLHFNTLNSTHL